MNTLEKNDMKASISNRTPSSWQVSEKVQEAVDKYISDDPVRYRLAQKFGDFLTDHPVFNQVDEFKPSKARDIAGEELQYIELCKLMRYYGLKPIEMRDDELALIKEKLGMTWKDQLINDYGFNLEDFSK